MLLYTQSLDQFTNTLQKLLLVLGSELLFRLLLRLVHTRLICPRNTVCQCYKLVKK